LDTFTLRKSYLGSSQQKRTQPKLLKHSTQIVPQSNAGEAETSCLMNDEQIDTPVRWVDTLSKYGLTGLTCIGNKPHDGKNYLCGFDCLSYNSPIESI